MGVRYWDSVCHVECGTETAYGATLVGGVCGPGRGGPGSSGMICGSAEPPPDSICAPPHHTLPQHRTQRGSIRQLRTSSIRWLSTAQREEAYRSTAKRPIAVPPCTAPYSTTIRYLTRAAPY
eukprot:3543211-Rhodomonas_salina.2